MVHISNVLKAIEDVEEFAQILYKDQPKFVKDKFNQVRSIHRRLLVPAWRGKPIVTGAKATDKQCAEADAFLATQPVHRYGTALEDLRTGLQMMTASQSSGNTSKSVLNWYLRLAKQLPWYPLVPSLKIQNQCRPPRYLSGRGHPSELSLTERAGQYQLYRLTEAETSPILKAELDELHRYWAAPVYLGRVCQAVRRQTADAYAREARLMLGYVHRKLGIPLNELGLEHLVPLVPQDQLESLTKRQQDDLWYEKHLYLEGWASTSNTSSNRTIL